MDTVYVNQYGKEFLVITLKRFWLEDHLNQLRLKVYNALQWNFRFSFSLGSITLLRFFLCIIS